MLESFYPSGSPCKNSTLTQLRPGADSGKTIALVPATVNSQPSRLAGSGGVSALVEAPDSSGNSSCRYFRFY